MVTRGARDAPGGTGANAGGGTHEHDARGKPDVPYYIQLGCCRRFESHSLGVDGIIAGLDVPNLVKRSRLASSVHIIPQNLPAIC